MPDETDDPIHTTAFLLGRIDSKLDGVCETLQLLRQQIAASDARQSHTERRIEHIERAVAVLEGDRKEAQEARLTAARRALTRHDGVLIVGVGAVLSAVLNVVSRLGDFLSRHPHPWPW